MGFLLIQLLMDDKQACCVAVDVLYLSVNIE